MAHYAYIKLTNSNSTISKQFRVIQDGRKVSLSKNENVEFTIGGRPDVSMGAVQEMHSYTIRVRQGNEPDTAYGVLKDLEDLFRYNNPNGTPSNIITLKDHYGVDKSVYLIGEFQESVMGIEIEGVNAWFLIELNMLVIPS